MRAVFRETSREIFMSVNILCKIELSPLSFSAKKYLYIMKKCAIILHIQCFAYPDRLCIWMRDYG